MILFELIIFIAVYIAFSIAGQVPACETQKCDAPDLEDSYQKSMHELTIHLFKVVGVQTRINFVVSLYSVWIILAAIAEGSNKETREQIFSVLKIPEDRCIRQKYYEIATTRASLVKDINHINSRMVLIDKALAINFTWHLFVTKNSLIVPVEVPVNEDTTDIRGLNLTGNSILLDSTKYKGLWTTALTDAVIERSPFYNQAGHAIGSVDLMKVKRRARMSYVKGRNCKVLELPVGSDGRYRMLLAMVLDKENVTNALGAITNDIIFEMFASLRESRAPFDIAIPRIDVTGEVDMRKVLEELGVKNVWTDPEATKFISTPPAFPTSFVQRTTVSFNKEGVNLPPVEQYSTQGCSLGLDPKVGSDFIANQPFLMALFDAETYTPLLGLGFSIPTYPDVPYDTINP